MASEVVHTLRCLALLDDTSERIVFRAAVSHDGMIILHGSEDDLDELLGHVAAEANHEHDTTRQKRLDTAFEILNHALENTIGP